MARGKRARISSRRASSSAASGGGPSTTVTDVAMVATALTGDEVQLPQARRRLEGDRVGVREAGVAVAGVGAIVAVHRGVQPLQREVAERVRLEVLADLFGRLLEGDQLLLDQNIN